MAFDKKKIIEVIRAHLDMAKKDAPMWDEMRAMYRCEQQKGAKEDGPATETGALFAYFDSMVSSICPPNPQVTAIPMRRALRDPARYREAMINDSLTRTQAARTLWRAAGHAGLYGHGVLKGVWNFTKKRPDFLAIDPRCFFYDETAARWQDVQYYCEMSMLSKAELGERMKIDPETDQSIYDPNIARTAQFGSFPEWLKSESTGRAELSNKIRDAFEWTQVFEFWDFTSKPPRYYHFLLDKEQPLLDDDLPYVFVRDQFHLLTFNDDLVSPGGLSDALIVRDPIKALDELRTLKLRFVQATIPFNMVDATAFDSIDEEKDKLAKATGPWDLVDLKMKQGRSMADSMSPSPTPSLSPAFDSMSKDLTEEILFRLGMPQYARGMTGQAEVATELALADAALRTRQGRRAENVDEAVLFMAKSIIGLYEEFLPADSTLPVRLGGSEFEEIARRHFQARDPKEALQLIQQGLEPEEPLEIDYKVVPYSPVENSKVAQLKKIQEFGEVLFNNPKINQEKLLEKLVDLIELGDDLVIAEEPQAPEAPGAAPSPVPGAPSPTGQPIQTEFQAAEGGGDLARSVPGPEGLEFGAAPGMAGGPGNPSPSRGGL